jgi:hypothetical protein
MNADLKMSSPQLTVRSARRMKAAWLAFFTICFAIHVGAINAAGDGLGTPAKVRDILWVWAIPGRGEQSAVPQTLASFGQASPARRMELLQVPNVIMAGSGIPNEQTLALAHTEAVQHADRIVWEILPDGEVDYHDKFQYEQRARQVCELAAKHPQIVGILLDDMTSVAVRNGFKPEHIRALKDQLARELIKVGRSPTSADLETWGVVYTMNFDQKNIADYIEELDVINLWVWKPSELENLESSVEHCRKSFPGKSVVLGLYLYDYAYGRPMPAEIHQRQCETALKLVRAGKIDGIVFLTNDKDDNAIHEWTADWIKQVGNQALNAK